MLSHLMLPREGHLDAAVDVMAYSGQKYNSKLVHDLSYQEIDHRVFKKCDWSVFCWDSKEAIMVNITEP